MKKYWIGCAFVVAGAMAGASGYASAEQKTPDHLIPRAVLFGHPERSDPRISPDGKKLSWLAPVNGVVNIWVGPIDNLGAGIPIPNGQNQKIGRCRWTYDGRHILCMSYSDGDRTQHILSVDVEDRTMTDVIPYKGIPAFIEGMSRKIRDQVMVGLYKSSHRYPDYYKLDLKTNELKPMFRNTDFVQVILDNQLVPRLAIKVRSNGDTAVMSISNSGGTRLFTEIPAEDARNSQWYGFDDTDAHVFVSDSRGRDTSALALIDFSTGKEQLLVEDPRADIGAVVVNDSTNQPLLYSVNYIHHEQKVLDPKIQPDVDILSTKFGDEWGLINQSEDGRMWLVATAEDTSPTTFYLFDRGVKVLKELFVSRPDLQVLPLTHMHGEVIKSRDGLDLVSYVTLPRGAGAESNPDRPTAPLPMVLLVHGGPAHRDSFGMNVEHQWLANRGYAVLSVNFRGSAGFGKAFINAGNGEWGRKMDDDLLDAVDWAIKQGIADPKRIAIMGASFGGYAALVGMTRDPDTYACGIDLSGPSDLELLLKALPANWEPYRPMIYRDMGDPSSTSGLAVLKERSPLNHVDQIKKPLMIVQGEKDILVPRAQADRMAAAVKAHGTPLAYLLYSNEAHGFDSPVDSISSAAAIESFLGTCLSGRIEPINEGELKGVSIEIVEGAELIPGLAAALKSHPAVPATAQ